MIHSAVSTGSDIEPARAGELRRSRNSLYWMLVAPFGLNFQADPVYFRGRFSCLSDCGLTSRAVAWTGTPRRSSEWEAGAAISGGGAGGGLGKGAPRVVDWARNGPQNRSEKP